MSQYHRLSFKEREEVSRCLSMQLSYRRIAHVLNRAASTITREVARHSADAKDYRAIPAQKQAVRSAKEPRKRRKLDVNLRLQEAVIKLLHARWSPEQIANRLPILYPDDVTMRISPETIYAYIYVHPRHHLKRKLLFQLRRQHKFRRDKSKERSKSNPIQDYISIDERPAEVEQRRIAGHWEGDLVMGPLNKSAIGTLVERTTRMTLIVKLKGKDAPSVCKAFARKFNSLPEEIKKSLTYDQGQEMAEHKQFTAKTKIKVYFAHPHSPWERGTSENTNSLIRDFFPSGTDFAKVSAYQLKKVERLLNDRPRKVLDFNTPLEVFTRTVALGPRF
jgi:IS30 family transposase